MLAEHGTLPRFVRGCRCSACVGEWQRAQAECEAKVRLDRLMAAAAVSTARVHFAGEGGRTVRLPACTTN